MQQKAVFLTWPFLLALVVILAALFFMRGSVGASHPDIESRLDHFLCYTDLKPISPEHGMVGLDDQFDAEPVKAQVLDSRLFCNPANKEHGHGHTSIIHAENHLVLYDLRHPKVPNRAVEVDNQFGKGQRLKVGQAVGLFVPTMTVYTLDDGTLGFAPTAELDHFKCYDVKGENVKQKVSVSDEFVPEMSAAGVYAPDMLCNPVVKIHPIDSTTVTRTDILNSDDHLVCYRLRMKQSTHKIMFHNQFESRDETVVDGPKLLCAPSIKRHIDDSNGGHNGNGRKGGRG